MSGQNYIDLAQQHIVSSDEAIYRCAISRFYYGLLHKAIDKLVSLEPANQDIKDNLLFKQDAHYSIHSDTIRTVKKYNSAIAGDLDIAKRLRVLADYNFIDECIIPITVKNDSNMTLKTFNSQEQLKTFLEDLSTKLQELSKPVRRLQESFTDFRFK
jgi:hypothetical protein